MRIMKKGALVAALIATTAVAPALAQSAGTILTIDMDRLLADSLAAKSAQGQLTTRYQATQTQVNTELQASGQALQTQETAVRTALGGTQDASKVPAATQQAYLAAQQRFANARQNAVQLNQAVQESQNYARDQIIAAVVPIAEQVRAERRATLIVPRGSALAADPAGDVTAVLLPRLDAALKTVAIVPPQDAAAPAAAGAAPRAATPGAARPAAPAPAPAGARRPQPQGR